MIQTESIYYKILGVKKNSTLDQIKKAYREKVRLYHPDLQAGHDAVQNHLRMIQLNRAYDALKRKLGGGGVGDLRHEEMTCESAEKRDCGSALVRHKDPAYVYYKQGYTLFSKVHPNSWYWSYRDEMYREDSKSDFDSRIIASLKQIIEIIPRAYYFFSVVVEDFPSSPWFSDSRIKMHKIERLTPIYNRILNSYQEGASHEDSRTYPAG